MTERAARRRTRRFEVEEGEPRTAAPWVDEDEAEEEAEPKPRRRPAPREEEDEEEPRPVTRRKKAAPVDDYDEETGDEEADGEETIDIPILQGDDAIRAKRSANDNAYFRYPPEEGEEQVVKFLKDEPWAYEQHWIKRQGKQSFPCIGADCPLCAIGSKTSTKMVYSVVNLSLDSMPVQTLEVTPTNHDTLRAANKDKKKGPLTRMYWALSRTKKAKTGGFGAYNYSFVPVKERDLEEDFHVDPVDVDKAVEAAEIPTPKKVLGRVTRSMLEEIAEEDMSAE